MRLVLWEAEMSAEAGKKHGHTSTSGDRKSKRKLKRKETYSVYIYKVLKQVRKWGFFILLGMDLSVKLLLPVVC